MVTHTVEKTDGDWTAFERAIDAVVKSGPQHRAKQPRHYAIGICDFEEEAPQALREIMVRLADSTTPPGFLKNRHFLDKRVNHVHWLFPQGRMDVVLGFRSAGF
jgi:hypothetical protein